MKATTLASPQVVCNVPKKKLVKLKRWHLYLEVSQNDIQLRKFVIYLSKWMLHRICICYLKLYLFQDINYSIFKLMTTLENQVSCNFMLKCYITILLQQFPNTLNQFLNVPRANKNAHAYVIWEIKWIKAVLKYFG